MTETASILFAFYFCFVKFLNMLKTTADLQQYRKVTKWRKKTKHLQE